MEEILTVRVTENGIEVFVPLEGTKDLHKVIYRNRRKIRKYEEVPMEPFSGRLFSFLA
jgi:hypothetical protein